MISSTPGRWLALCVVAALALLAYLPGLHGPFVLDDLPSILTNPRLRLNAIDVEGLLDAARSGESGPLGRPLAYASFALGHAIAGGFDPFAFKLANLFVHLVNVLLVYCLAAGIASVLEGEQAGRRAPAVALLAAAIWALHPIQVVAILYTVQRMTSLSALGALLGLVVFLHYRRQYPAGGRGRLWLAGTGLGVGTALGLGAKESAALVPVLAFALEWAVFDRARLDRRARRGLYVFYTFVLAIPALLVLGLVVAIPDIVFAGYAERDFGWLERLLTESRVLVYYAGLIVVPRIGELSLVHDDIAVSRGFLDPMTTLPALAIVGGAAVAAARARGRAPAVALALAWFGAGHLLESTILPLELVYEHRNYLPTVGPCFALAWYLNRLPVSAFRVLGAGIVLGLATLTWARAGHWQDGATLTAALVRHHPGSARAHGMRAQHLIDSAAAPGEIYRELRSLARLDPGNVTALGEMLRMVSARRTGGDRPPGPPTSAPPPRLVEGSELPAAGTDPAALEAALVYELEERLARRPITAETVQALVEQGACVLRGESRCVRLAERTRTWFAMVLAERPVKGRFRAMLHVQLARLCASVSPDAAVRELRAAIAADPTPVAYAVELADLLLALGRRDEARPVLTDVAQRRDLSRPERAVVRALLARTQR